MRHMPQLNSVLVGDNWSAGCCLKIMPVYSILRNSQADHSTRALHSGQTHTQLRTPADTDGVAKDEELQTLLGQLQTSISTQVSDTGDRFH